MVLIHSMDSDEELQIQTYEEPDAFAASSSDMRSSGIKMTPKVPRQFDGQSSWFEFEDLIDDWLGITTLDQETWTVPEECTSRSSLILQIHARQHSSQRS